MKNKDFISYGKAKKAEKKIIDAVCAAVEKHSDINQQTVHVEVAVTELEPGLNELVIRLIEGESYRKLVELIDEQLKEEMQQKGGIH